jgi:hypothetical protein
MLRNIAVASVLALGGLVLAVQHASAAPMSSGMQTLQAGTVAEKAQWRYCRRWNRECRARWGRGWDYRRCMRRHGC